MLPFYSFGRKELLSDLGLATVEVSRPSPGVKERALDSQIPRL